MKIQKNISLKNYTTFKIGGPAEFFVEIKNILELQEVLKWAQENNQPIKILGSGSNLIISDEGLKGLVIKLNLNKLEFKDNKVIVGSGVILAYLLNKSLKEGLIGLEFVAGIPGTMGGAVRGNAGTYGQAIGNIVKTVQYLDENYEVKILTKEQAKFDYRHSIFKENSWIVLETEISLVKGNIETTKKLIKERLKYRHSTQPHKPSAGCIFKNIRFEDVNLKDLKKKNIDIDRFSKFKKIPTAYLIELAGLKGYTIGQAQISEVHANYIINKGGATAEQVIMLISLIKQQVRDKYGIQLHEEVQLLV